MNKVIDKGFRSCRFVSTIVKHPCTTFNMDLPYARINQCLIPQHYMSFKNLNMNCNVTILKILGITSLPITKMHSFKVVLNFCSKVLLQRATGRFGTLM